MDHYLDHYPKHPNSVQFSQQQELMIADGQQEPGKSDEHQKGKVTVRAAPKSKSKAPQKSHELTFPSKRKGGAGAPEFWKKHWLDLTKYQGLNSMKYQWGG